MDKPESVKGYPFPLYDERHTIRNLPPSGPAEFLPEGIRPFPPLWRPVEYESIPVPHVSHRVIPLDHSVFQVGHTADSPRLVASSHLLRRSETPQPTLCPPQSEVPMLNYGYVDGPVPFAESPYPSGIGDSHGEWFKLDRYPQEFYPVERDCGLFRVGYMEDLGDFTGRKLGYQDSPGRWQTAWEGNPGFLSAHSPFLKSARNLCRYLKGLKRERMELQRERRVLEKLNSGVEEILQYCRNEEKSKETQPQGSDGYRPSESRLHGGCYGEQQCNGEAHATGGNGASDDTTRGPRRPSNIEDARLALNRYNSAWLEVLSNSNTTPAVGRVTVPWPSNSLQADELSQVIPFTYQRSRIPHEITEDIFQLRKWNAFRFFTQACGLRSSYRLGNVEDSDSRTALRLEIQMRGASRRKLETLKSQLVREKLRWHPDRLRRMGIGNLPGQEEETAKAVWGAVIDASKACERCLEEISKAP